jgi:hypothetical protein
MRGSRQRLQLLQPDPKPRVIQSKRCVEACLVESLRRVAVFASVAKPTVVPARPTCCYDSNGKPLKAEVGKPAGSKKPYKKFGGNKSMVFVQTMFKAYLKAKKEAGKSKKRKKRDYDSSDSSYSE